MNYQRILRITNYYFLFTGYQIRGYDRKSEHYRFTICGILYFLILILFYLICFGHHFEKSSMLKMLLDLSPFLKNLVRLQALLGFKVFIFCIIEWRSLTKILNGLVDIFIDSFERKNSMDRSEAVAYIMFFSTLAVGFGFGLYIAIELKFELPPLDHIMIGTALFVPHLTIAGCLRLYTLGLFLIKHELDYLKINLQKKEEDYDKPPPNVVIEIINPVLNKNLTSEGELSKIYQQTLKRLELIAHNLTIFDFGLQKHLSLLVALNYNCLLFGAYSKFYFENTWYVIFSDRNRRIFYAANSAIFVCIILDYAILLLTHYSFNKTIQNLNDFIYQKLCEKKNPLEDMQHILKDIKRVLRKKINLKLFNSVEFNAWNFLMVQGLMLSIIAIIITYQYLNDQIVALTILLSNDDSD